MLISPRRRGHGAPALAPRRRLARRYGDVVNISGRATTVVTNDNIAIIVPNSSFVGEPVTNRSYPTREVRFNIPVGVAYGSDPERVRDVLLQVARAHPGVLRSRRPTCCSRNSATARSTSCCGSGRASTQCDQASSAGSLTTLSANSVSATRSAHPQRVRRDTDGAASPGRLRTTKKRAGRERAAPPAAAPHKS